MVSSNANATGEGHAPAGDSPKAAPGAAPETKARVDSPSPTTPKADGTVVPEDDSSETKPDAKPASGAPVVDPSSVVTTPVFFTFVPPVIPPSDDSVDGLVIHRVREMVSRTPDAEWDDLPPPPPSPPSLLPSPPLSPIGPSLPEDGTSRQPILSADKISPMPSGASDFGGPAAPTPPPFGLFSSGAPTPGTTNHTAEGPLPGTPPGPNGSGVSTTTARGELLAQIRNNKMTSSQPVVPLAEPVNPQSTIVVESNPLLSTLNKTIPQIAPKAKKTPLEQDSLKARNALRDSNIEKVVEADKAAEKKIAEMIAALRDFQTSSELDSEKEASGVLYSLPYDVNVQLANAEKLMVYKLAALAAASAKALAVADANIAAAETALAETGKEPVISARQKFERGDQSVDRAKALVKAEKVVKDARNALNSAADSNDEQKSDFFRTRGVYTASVKTALDRLHTRSTCFNEYPMPAEEINADIRRRVYTRYARHDMHKELGLKWTQKAADALVKAASLSAVGQAVARTASARVDSDDDDDADNDWGDEDAYDPTEFNDTELDEK